MKRPRAHEIETKSRQLFEAALPDGWVPRTQTPDYGVDYEVEVYSEGKSTGVAFKAQVKGTEKLALSTRGDFISHSLPVGSAVYLCRELDSPTVLTVVDVTTQTAYWTAPQLDKDLQARLPEALCKGQEHVTVRIPSRNVLARSQDELLNALADAQILLATRTVQNSTIPGFADATVGHFDPDALVQALTSKAAVVRVQQIRTHYNRDDPAAARMLLEQVLAMADVELGVKFAALAEVERQEALRFRYPPDTFDAEANLKLQTTTRMRSISVGGPAQLRLYALLAHKASELQMLAFEDWGLYYNWLVQQAARDPFWRVDLSLARQRTAANLVRKYRQCIRLANMGLRSGFHGILPEAAERILVAMLLFVNRLDKEGMAQEAHSYRRSLRDLAEMAVDIAVAAKRWEEVSLLVNAAFLLMAKLGDGEAIAKSAHWAEERLRRLPDHATRDEQLRLVRKHREELEAGAAETQSADRDAVERQIYATMAAGLGIDLRDERDPFAIMVRQGLKDLNPERALRHCKHLFLTLGPGGLPVVLLRLPTAGFKRLHCVMHGHRVEAFALDDCSQDMDKRFCSACREQEPHDPAWRWTQEWQQEQNRIYGHLVSGERDER